VIVTLLPARSVAVTVTVSDVLVRAWIVKGCEPGCSDL
jgi:hypothetical protein